MYLQLKRQTSYVDAGFHLTWQPKIVLNNSLKGLKVSNVF